MRSTTKQTASSRSKKLSAEDVNRFLSKKSTKKKFTASKPIKERFIKALTAYNDSVFELKRVIGALRKDSEKITIRTSELPGMFGDWSKELYNDVNKPANWNDFAIGYGFTAVGDWRMEWMKKKDEQRSRLLEETRNQHKEIVTLKRKLRSASKKGGKK